MGIPKGLRPTPFSPCYPEGIEEWIDVYGFAVPLAISDPMEEYDAVRNRVVALEYSMLYKWHVDGPGAIATAHAATSRNINGLGDGRLAYGVVVAENGTMIDDVTVAVTGPDHVLVTGGNPETEAALRSAAPAGTTVIERRDETAVLSLQGPNSRAVLESLTDADVSNSAFPYYTFRTDQTVAGIRCDINRVGFTAELGYEILAPRDRAVDLWEAVLAAGEPMGITPMGAAALMMCRVEAGMIMGELEYDETSSPFECRMGWAVDFDKGPFQGRQALLARKDGDRGRVVSITVDGPPEEADGRPLHREDVEVGAVTMAVPSPALGGTTLAMARIDRDAAPVGTELWVAGVNGRLRAQVITTPVYDPQRTRVRS